MDSIQHIPCIAVQGRLDFVTPVRTAYDLHCAWPEMELRVVPVRVATVHGSFASYDVFDLCFFPACEAQMSSSPALGSDLLP